MQSRCPSESLHCNSLTCSQAARILPQAREPRNTQRGGAATENGGWKTRLRKATARQAEDGEWQMANGKWANLSGCERAKICAARASLIMASRLPFGGSAAGSGAAARRAMNLNAAVGTTKYTKHTNVQQLKPGTLPTSQVMPLVVSTLCHFVSFVYFGKRQAKLGWF